MGHASDVAAQLSAERRPGNENLWSEKVLVVAICLAAGAIGLRALRESYPALFGKGVPDSERKAAKASALATYGSTGRSNSVVAVPPPTEAPGAGEGATLLRRKSLEGRGERERQRATQRLSERAAERKGVHGADKDDVEDEDGLGELGGADAGDFCCLSRKLKARLVGSGEGMQFDRASVSWKGNEADLDAFDEVDGEEEGSGELCASGAAQRGPGADLSLSAVEVATLRQAARQSEDLSAWFRDGRTPWEDLAALSSLSATVGRAPPATVGGA